MTNEIEQIRERCEQATPGPWKWKEDILCAPEPHYVVLKPFCDCVSCDKDNPTLCIFDNDKDFIANARTDIPALLASHDRLTAEVERLKQWKAVNSDLIEAYAEARTTIAALTARAEQAEREQDAAREAGFRDRQNSMVEM